MLFAPTAKLQTIKQRQNSFRGNSISRSFRERKARDKATLSWVLLMISRQFRACLKCKTIAFSFPFFRTAAYLLSSREHDVLFTRLHNGALLGSFQ